MSVEEIANVTADLRAGRINVIKPDLAVFAQPQIVDPVVDATAIYQSLVAKDDPVYIYEDHPCISPPWEHGAICYANEHGNAIVMVLSLLENTTRWEPASPVDWDRVKWWLQAVIFVGGHSTARPGMNMPTTGPMHMWRIAIYEDGEPADLHWVQLVPEYPMDHWDMANLVLLGALNFVNCRNVELIEPKRPRAQARRLARTGIKVHTINVFPTGKSMRHSRKDGEALGTPLTSVMGHFAKYGPAYGRGLLFGKLAGRFWIPQHARGSADIGESNHDYKLNP